jgi:hypothetical protein
MLVHRFNSAGKGLCRNRSTTALRFFNTIRQKLPFVRFRRYGCYIKEAGLSVQGQAANPVWKSTFHLVKWLGVKLGGRLPLGGQAEGRQP